MLYFHCFSNLLKFQSPGLVFPGSKNTAHAPRPLLYEDSSKAYRTPRLPIFHTGLMPAFRNQKATGRYRCEGVQVSTTGFQPETATGTRTPQPLFILSAFVSSLASSRYKLGFMWLKDRLYAPCRLIGSGEVCKVSSRSVVFRTTCVLQHSSGICIYCEGATIAIKIIGGLVCASLSSVVRRV